MLAESAVTKTLERRSSAFLSKALSIQPDDPLLALIGAYRDDRRPQKIDLGVGVFRDDAGNTPVLRSVKAAEARLLRGQSTKGYLGPEGDAVFVESLAPLILGRLTGSAVYTGVQTPGGTGALRLGAELISSAGTNRRMWVGTPTWPNHLPIFAAANLEVCTYRFFDPKSQTVLFDELVDALEASTPGDVFLVHGCCHNPTGGNLEPSQWDEISRLLSVRGVLPFIDFAYQGLGHGLELDAAGVRKVLAAVDEALVAYSCDKNFGLYRERTGALFSVSGDRASANILRSNMLALARANWSMPPDHGAAVVRTILADDDLRRDWRNELEQMRQRIVDLRLQLSARDPQLDALQNQSGMFSMLALSTEQVRHLREEHAIYMAGSGRINIAGLRTDTIDRFAQALSSVRTDALAA